VDASAYVCFLVNIPHLGILVRSRSVLPARANVLFGSGNKTSDFFVSNQSKVLMSPRNGLQPP